jgi:DNA-binding SARP family transcriptional activator
MDFHILGPLEVLDGGRPVDLGRPKQRAVLALLLISANRVMSLDRMIELLWDGEAPARATGALQAYVSNLRRALEPARPARTPARVLVTQAPGYLLRVAAEDLDSARFEHLAARGHEFLAAGRPSSARSALDEALSLWRGPALAEYAGERFAVGETARLEARRAVAVEDRFEADLQLGAHGRVVAELESAVLHDPLRERAWSLLMLALYRSGQQGEALRAYGRARRHLAEELGVEPSPGLRALEAAILAQSPALDWRPPADGDDRPPPAAAPPPPAIPAPPPDDGLVGRLGELGALTTAFAEARAGRGRMVTVAGEAGIGKTRLAEELAAYAAAQGATVVWGRAYESEGAPPFWLWIQVLRGLSTEVGPDALAPALTGAGELLQLVPELAAPGGPAPLRPATAPPPGPAAARFRLYEAVTRLLVTAAQHRPLVVLLDDLHWADPSSLQLLGHLAQRMEAAGILLVAAYRDPASEEAGPLGDVLGELARLRPVGRA